MIAVLCFSLGMIVGCDLTLWLLKRQLVARIDGSDDA